MKKQYSGLQITVYQATPSNIICVSSGLGEGNTDIMHAKMITLSDDSDMTDDDMEEEYW